jgi:signal transduction histidine kinase
MIRFNFRSPYFPLFLLAVSSLYGFFQINQLVKASRWVEHTDVVISKIHELAMGLKVLESEGRGFLLYHDQAFLKRGAVENKEFLINTNSLTELIKDNPDQTAKFNQIKDLIDEWELSGILVVKMVDDKKIAKKAIALHRKKNYLGRIMMKLSELERQEAQMRDERVKSTQKYIFRGSFYLISVFGINFIWLIFLVLRREYLDKKLRLAKAEYQNLYESEKRAVIARDDTLSIVSHDLKNPLMAITAAAEYLRNSLNEISKEEVQKKFDRMLSLILKSSTLATHLIKDLLEVGKMEAGYFVLEKNPASLTKLIEDCVQTQKASSMKNQLTMNFTSIGDFPLLEIDELKIDRVITNLINNAIKFCEEPGKIELSAEVKEDQVLVTVSDDGPGIPEAIIPKLFNRYYQPDATKMQGTGLGLYICRIIIEAHGGKIWVENLPQRGCRFSFSIPVKINSIQPALESCDQKKIVLKLA